MKLFKHSNGTIIAFGFDMRNRVEARNLISWSDTDGKTWEPHSDNSAGSQTVSWGVDPQFVFEVTGDVVAYQPGRCTVMHYIGNPYVWGFTTMLSDEAGQLRAA